MPVKVRYSRVRRKEHLRKQKAYRVWVWVLAPLLTSDKLLNFGVPQLLICKIWIIVNSCSVVVRIKTLGSIAGVSYYYFPPEVENLKQSPQLELQPQGQKKVVEMFASGLAGSWDLLHRIGMGGDRNRKVHGWEVSSASPGSCVTWEKAPNLSVLQFPHLNRENNTLPTVLPRWLNEITLVGTLWKNTILEL